MDLTETVWFRINFDSMYESNKKEWWTFSTIHTSLSVTLGCSVWIAALATKVAGIGI